MSFIAIDMVPFFYFSCSSRAGEAENSQMDVNWIEATNKKAAVKVFCCSVVM
jgi:hypothetical protein